MSRQTSKQTWTKLPCPHWTEVNWYGSIIKAVDNRCHTSRVSWRLASDCWLPGFSIALSWASLLKAPVDVGMDQNHSKRIITIWLWE
jgi:hypothetical protein